jgi:hypothetical protein
VTTLTDHRGGAEYAEYAEGSSVIIQDAPLSNGIIYGSPCVLRVLRVLRASAVKRPSR